MCDSFCISIYIYFKLFEMCFFPPFYIYYVDIAVGYWKTWK